jgi:hypothetical protein
LALRTDQPARPNNFPARTFCATGRGDVALIRYRAAEEQAVETARSHGLGQISHYQFIPDTHPHARDMTMIDPGSATWLQASLLD